VCTKDNRCGLLAATAGETNGGDRARGTDAKFMARSFGSGPEGHHKAGFDRAMREAGAEAASGQEYRNIVFSAAVRWWAAIALASITPLKWVPLLSGSGESAVCDVLRVLL
jgi:hypothetical protein